MDYIVYAKIDAQGRIAAINSSAFLTDTNGWTEIDSGVGDMYHHAQVHYLPAPIITQDGVYRYKIIDGAVTERTVEEMEADIVAAPATPTPMEKLREDVDYLLVAEMQREGLL